jgi:tRNA(Arg) A34 adenosine deaminase TadA
MPLLRVSFFSISTAIAQGGFMTNHEGFIKQCHDLAISAGKKGNHTFGAVLVHKNEGIMKAENTVNSDDDPTRHAELNLVVKSRRVFSQDILKVSILYTSTAPCLMCTAAIWEAGITKIAYSVSYEAFFRLSGYQSIPCEEVFDRLGTPVEIIGPILEEEGLAVFQYWPI